MKLETRIRKYTVIEKDEGDGITSYGRPQEVSYIEMRLVVPDLTRGLSYDEARRPVTTDWAILCPVPPQGHTGPMGAKGEKGDPGVVDEDWLLTVLEKLQKGEVGPIGEPGLQGPGP